MSPRRLAVLAAIAAKAEMDIVLSELADKHDDRAFINLISALSLIEEATAALRKAHAPA